MLVHTKYLTKFVLLSLLGTKGAASVTFRRDGLPDVSGILSSVQREDGSGSSFNIAVDTGEGTVWVYARTTD